MSVTGIVIRSGIGTFNGVTVTNGKTCTGLRNFTFLPMAYFASTVAAFMNRGLNTKRCSQIGGNTHFNVLYSVTVTRVMNVVLFFNSRFLVNLFASRTRSMVCNMVGSRSYSLFFFVLTTTRYFSTIVQNTNGSAMPVLAVLVY